MAFKKGRSGNAKGRPKGSAPAAKLRQAIEDDLPDIITALVDAAKTGDTAAAKLLLDRAIPALRPTTQAITFKLDAEASLSDQARQIMQAVASGEIPADNATQLVSGLASTARIVEVDELEKRLIALEDLQNGNS